jgi:NADH-quinone oxidoreductase subunit N
VVLAVINSAVSIYYYFKVIIAMYFSKETNEDTRAAAPGVQWVVLAGMVLIALLTLIPGSVYYLLEK